LCNDRHVHGRKAGAALRDFFTLFRTRTIAVTLTTGLIVGLGHLLHPKF